MKVERLTGDISELVTLLDGGAFDPLACMKEYGSNLQGYYLEDIRGILDDNGFLLAATEKGKIFGFAVLAKLTWDSDYFRKRMGVIKYFAVMDPSPGSTNIAARLLKKVLDIAKNNRFEFLLCKCSTHNIGVIHALENHGFLLMDTMLDYLYDYKNPPLDALDRLQCPEGFSVRLATPNDQEELMRLSMAAFTNHFGRFHSDDHISTDQSTGVYEQWLKSSCEGWADWIIAACTGDRIAGYSVWKKPSDRELKHVIKLGHYSIGAVHPDYKKQGLFPLLTYEGMKLLVNDCAAIEGPTHVNNYGVQKGYAKLGWTIRGSRHSFHKWL